MYKIINKALDTKPLKNGSHVMGVRFITIIHLLKLKLSPINMEMFCCWRYTTSHKTYIVVKITDKNLGDIFCIWNRISRDPSFYWKGYVIYSDYTKWKANKNLV